jgi:hypothetical protein
VKQVFKVKIEVDAAALPTADTVDYELSRMAAAMSLFASEYLITLTGAADGVWHGRYQPPTTAIDDEW